MSENGEKKIERIPVMWVNFVDKNGQKENTGYRMFVNEAATFQGTVEFFGESEVVRNGRRRSGKALVIKSNDGKKYGFNFDRREYIYNNRSRTIVISPYSIEKGKPVTVKFFPVGNVKIVVIE